MAPVAEPLYEPPEESAEVLRCDDEMRRYFSAVVPSIHRDRATLERLVEAVLSPAPGGLGFVYDSEAVFDARETFRRRRGNCLGFSVLIASILREYGFDAEFQQLERRTWHRYGTHIVAEQHVNLVVEARDGTYVVDLRPGVAWLSGAAPFHQVADHRVLAEFYSDFGFFELVHGRPDAALRWMTYGTTIDPRCAYAWSNRATMHAQMGDLAAARACYERALAIAPRGDHALVGYVEVLRRLGTPEDLRRAQKLERRAQALRERNPYYHWQLAEAAVRAGNWAAADKAMRRALDLKDDDPEFYHTWIPVLRQLGRNRDADRAARQLANLEGERLHRSR